MKSAQLHDNIRYISLADDEGDFGLLVHHDGMHVYNVFEVHDHEQFTRMYEELIELV